MDLFDGLRLKNGMLVRVLDQSRRIAGDRFLVRLLCEATAALDDACFEGLQESEPELLVAVRERMAGELRFALAKERTFIAEEVREEVFQQMLADIERNVLPYLSASDFPARLFARRYRELRQTCLLACHRPDCAEEDDEDGPADFSGCFREMDAG